MEAIFFGNQVELFISLAIYDDAAMIQNLLGSYIRWVPGKVNVPGSVIVRAKSTRRTCND